MSANETHLCTDAPKRNKVKRPPSAPRGTLSASVSSFRDSDGAGSSEEDHSDDEHSHAHVHDHSHSHSHSVPAPAAASIPMPSSRRRLSPPLPRSNISAFLADPDVAFHDETDYLSSLYLVELARRAALEVSEAC